MDEIKNAVKNLEDAILDLEVTLHTVKKSYKNKSEPFRDVVKTVYDKVDKMILTLKQGEE